MKEIDYEIETFIESTIRPIAKRLSTEEIVELRIEIRSHLVEQIEAYLELGYTKEEAISTAKRTFGKNQTLDAMPSRGVEWSFVPLYVLGSWVMTVLILILCVYPLVLAINPSSESFLIDSLRMRLELLYVLYIAIQSFVAYGKSKSLINAGVRVALFLVAINFLKWIIERLFFDQKIMVLFTAENLMAMIFSAVVTGFVNGCSFKLIHNYIDHVRVRGKRRFVK